MSQASLEDLSFVPLEPAQCEPVRCSASARLNEARGVFDSASRLVAHVDPERPAQRGPGWFDSSWDLRRGCEVREGLPGDATLRGWIEGWLYAAAGGGASLSAT